MNTTIDIGIAGLSGSPSSQIGLAGINLGFGFGKLVIEGKDHLFMSALTPLNRGVDGMAGRSMDRLNVVRDSDGKFYEVGSEGVLNSTDEPLKVLSREWARSKQYRLLMGAVLNRMAATGKRRWHITTGLAADHYRDKEYREDVSKIWSGNNGFFSTPFGDVEIESVKVLPESVGGVVELMATPQTAMLMSTSSGVVIDFGRKTTNWVPFKNGQVNGERIGSADVGISNIITEATKQVRLDAGKPTLHPLEVEAAMLGLQPIFKTVVSNSGEPEARQISIDLALSKAVNEVWPTVEQELANNLGDLRGLTIIGIGGGAKIFGQQLKRTYASSVVLLPEGAQHMNARGLYRMLHNQHVVGQKA